MKECLKCDKYIKKMIGKKCVTIMAIDIKLVTKEEQFEPFDEDMTIIMTDEDPEVIMKMIDSFAEGLMVRSAEEDNLIFFPDFHNALSSELAGHAVVIPFKYEELYVEDRRYEKERNT